MNKEHIEAKAKEYIKSKEIHPTYVVYSQFDFHERKEPINLKELLTDFALSLQPEGVMVKEVKGKDIQEGDVFWAENRWETSPEDNPLVSYHDNTIFLVKINPK